MKKCPRCDTISGALSDVVRMMYYPAREEDDEYCMKCGDELLDNIPNICTNCNEPRRLANTIVNPTLVENDYVRYCHVCGNDCTRIKS